MMAAIMVYLSKSVFLGLFLLVSALMTIHHTYTTCQEWLHHHSTTQSIRQVTETFGDESVEENIVGNTAQ